jgi:hypothetical protein
MSENRNDGSTDRNRALFLEIVREVEQDPGSPDFPVLAESYRRGGQPERARTLAQNGLAVAPERLAGRVALGLALIDLGEISESIQELECILENVPELPSDLDSPRVEAAVAVPEQEPAVWPSEAAEVLHDGQEPLRSPAWAAPLAEPGPVSTPDVSDRIAGRIEAEEIDRAFDRAEAEDPEEALDPPTLVEVTLGREGEDASVPGFAPVRDPELANCSMIDLLESHADAYGIDEAHSSVTRLDDDHEAERVRTLSAPEAHDVEAEPAEPEGSADSAVVERLEQWLVNIRRKVA